MLALLGILLFVLPLGLRGDGTAAGILRMHIRYSLGLSALLLAGMTLWMSCASIATDLSSKRLQMLLTKPVSRAILWWGKWAAVSSIITALLFLCGAVTLLRMYGIRASIENPDELRHLQDSLLTARAPLDPLPVDLRPIAERLLAEQLAANAIPPEADREDILEQLTQYAAVMRNSSAPGSSVSWDYDLPAPLRPGTALQLAYQFDGSSLGTTRVPGTWSVGTPDNPALWTHDVDKAPQGEHLLFPNRDNVLAGATRLRVTFTNRGEADSMVFFRSEEGVRLYLPGGHFAPNLFRALILYAGLLSLLAAIGMSAGAVFSLPVACYATSAILLLQTLSGTLEKAVTEGTALTHMHEAPAAIRIMDHATLATYRTLLFLLRPLELAGPLDRVARGILVSPAETARALALRFSPVLLVISFSGILLFHRRETGGAE
jgi:hypothetical protein